LQPGQDWRNSPSLAAVQKEVDDMLAGQGRVLIRASGTEPLLRVMVEAREKELADRCAQMLAEAVTV